MARISVVGLGHVGLPLAVSFDRAGHDVFGYDVDSVKVRELDGGTDRMSEVGSETVRRSNVTYTVDPSCIDGSDYVIIAVPTPLDEGKRPDLTNVRAAAEVVGTHLSADSTIVLESTVYPGATRDVLIPILEAEADMEAGREFYVGYSPERVVPGDESRKIDSVVKIVSGQDEQAVRALVDLYEDVVHAGVHPAPELEVAEAAKCLENAQRDVNIALMNEFVMGCARIDERVEPHAVLEAAGTKWNFHQYSPGLVGGHCLPIDPYYLAHAFGQHNFDASLIRRARTVNERLARHVSRHAIELLGQRRGWGRVVGETETDGGVTAARQPPSVLLLGLTYKRNSSDLRHPPVRTIVEDLGARGIEVTGFDPNVRPREVTSALDISAQAELSASGFAGLLLLTGHDDFRDLDVERIRGEMDSEPVLIDLPGLVGERRARECGFTYWGLGR